MKILITQGPHAGTILDMSTRQAANAIAAGWATLPPPAPDPVPVASAPIEAEAVPVPLDELAEEPAADMPAIPRRRGRG
jgi:hypothetical protein